MPDVTAINLDESQRLCVPSSLCRCPQRRQKVQRPPDSYVLYEHGWNQERTNCGYWQVQKPKLLKELLHESRVRCKQVRVDDS